MMKTLISLALLALPLLAADIPGFKYWSPDDIKAMDAKAAARMKDAKSGGEGIGNWGNHTAMLSRRTGDGEAEVHEQFTDIFIVEAGEGTLVVGGSVVNPKTTGAGEIRGSGLEGGERFPMKPGTIVNIPAGVPHQIQVPKEFTAIIVKVKKPA